MNRLGRSFTDGFWGGAAIGAISGAMTGIFAGAIEGYGTTGGGSNVTYDHGKTRTVWERTWTKQLENGKWIKVLHSYLLKRFSFLITVIFNGCLIRRGAISGAVF